MNMKLIALGVVALHFAGHAVAQEIPTEADAKIAERKPVYSPYPDQKFPNRVFWGDTHHHSSFSCDAGMMGATLDPETSYRFARGEEVASNSGQRVRLSRPLDFLNVSDHAEFIGLANMLNEKNPDLLATPIGKRWYDMVKAGGAQANAA